MDDLYRFSPTEDITSYELSLIMREMLITLVNSLNKSFSIQDDNNLDIEEGSYRKLPIKVRKHFIKKQ